MYDSANPPFNHEMLDQFKVVGSNEMIRWQFPQKRWKCIPFLTFHRPATKTFLF